MRRIVTFGLCLALPVLAAGQTKDDFEFWDQNNNGDLTCSEAKDGPDGGLRLPAYEDDRDGTGIIYEWLERRRSSDSDNDGVACESTPNAGGYVPNVQPVEPQGCPADAETWRGLRVCEEQPREGYDRDAFGSAYSSLEDDIIDMLPPTMKVGGQVYTPYSCLAFEIRADGTAATDIEHIVALAEAHDSRIADDRRRDIASDLDNLTIADPTVNRSQKSDRDAAEWMPARHGAWFAAQVIAVKLEYGLSVDPAERDALETLLAGDGAQLNCVDADTTSPTVAISSDANAPVTGPFSIAITFSEPVTGFELEDLVVANGSVSEPQGNDATYTATITPEASGTVTVGIPAGAAQDSAGNHSAAADQFSIVADLSSSNRPPEPVGVLPPLTMWVDDEAVSVDVASAFRDPDGDALTYAATSSVPAVASVAVLGSTVTVTSVSEGTTTVTVTSTDAGGSNQTATQMFQVTVNPPANRPPEPVGRLAPLTLAVDEAAASVEVSGAFRDPDGDALTYTATSSVPGVAAVTVSGSTVTVTPVSEGTSTVTVTATDADGSNGAATQSFTVMVGPAANRPPVLVGTLPPLTIRVDEAPVPIDVSGAFRDPDGDALTYGARSSSPGVVAVAVTVSGFTVTVRPVSEGTSTVTVTATDTGGSNETATQTFRVTVNPPANRPPEPVGRLAPLTLAVDEAAESVEVSGAFRDPDGDALTYTTTSSVPGVASVSVSGSVVTVTPLSEGTSTVTVTATDTGGSNTAATQSFTVTVGAPANRPPEPLGVLAPLTIGVDEASVTVEVSGAFRDPDGDELTYVAGSSSPGVASVSVSGSVVTVTPVSEGTSTVTVTATDTGGSNTAVTQRFTVTVTRAANRAPEPVGVLAPLTIWVDEAAVAVEVSGAFRDPDGDVLTYAAVSSAPRVASVSVSGSVVTVTPLSAGTSTVTVTATDTGGSNTAATQSFGVTVPRPFTDHPLVAGVTPVKAVHFTELRARIDALRRGAGLAPFAWTDRILTAGVTRVRLAHLLELRSAVGEAYAASGRSAPGWTDASPAGGATPIRAVHLMELRAAVTALE